MSENKKNEILEEQRRARQQFLELKKMQSGEAEPPPKPSEVALVPKTFKEKWDNFWFMYKWHTVAIVAIVAVMAVLITQCASRTSYDLEVVYFTYTNALDEQTAAVAEYFEEHTDDVNGDGEVHVQVINCSFSSQTGNIQYRNTILTKLQSIIAADENALLFVTDSEAYEYLSGISESGIFNGEPIMLGSDFYEKTKTEALGELPGDLLLSVRKIEGTVLEKKDGVKKAGEAAHKAAEKIQKAN